jgi:hypothetical protein
MIDEFAQILQMVTEMSTVNGQDLKYLRESQITMLQHPQYFPANRMLQRTENRAREYVSSPFLPSAIVSLSREIGLLAGKKRFYEETFTESGTRVLRGPIINKWRYLPTSDILCLISAFSIFNQLIKRA